MPTYQYQCTACGHRIDARQSFSDAPLTVCPNCEGTLRKLYNSIGVVFKGSGFYRNDSRAAREGAVPAGKNDGGSKSDSGSSTSESSSAPAKSGSGSSDSSGSSSSGSGSGSGGSGSGGSGSGGSGSGSKPAAATSAS